MENPLNKIVNSLYDIYGEKLLSISILNTTRQPTLANDMELLILVESYNDEDIVSEHSHVRRRILERSGIWVEPYIFSLDNICELFRSKKLVLSILGGMVIIYQKPMINIRRVLCECTETIGNEYTSYIGPVRNILCS